MFAVITPLISNLFLLFWLVGLVLLLSATRSRRGMRFVGLAFLAFLWIINTRPVSELLLKGLESEYSQPVLSRLRYEDVDQIVVLTGGGFKPSGELLNSAFPSASEQRFWSSLELAKRLGPQVKLIFSGSAGRGNRERSTALTMEQLARLMLTDCKTVSESKSGSTAEHPGNVGPLLRGDHFILVTSAYHMRRAMKSFQRAGLHPIAYPVDFMARGRYGWQDLLPSAEEFCKVNIALREYLAICLYTVKKW